MANDQEPAALPDLELDPEKQEKIRDLLRKGNEELSSIDAFQNAIEEGIFTQSEDEPRADN